MQRIELTDAGITVTHVEAEKTAYGRVYQESRTRAYELPWADITGVSLYALELPPHGERWITMTIDFVYGDFYEVGQDADGFAETLAELCRRSGAPVPDLSTITLDAVVVWGV